MFQLIKMKKFWYISLVIILCFKFRLYDCHETENKNPNKTTINNSIKHTSVKSPTAKLIKNSDNNYQSKNEKNESKYETKNKVSQDIQKQNEMYHIMQQHHIINDKELRHKGDPEEKKKGKLQTVGGVFGDIIGVLISEVVRLFGNIVSDVAREVTAHGFVSIFKQFTDFTGISLAENNLIY